MTAPLIAPVTNAVPGGAAPSARNWQRPALSASPAMRAALARAAATQAPVPSMKSNAKGDRHDV